MYICPSLVLPSVCLFWTEHLSICDWRWLWLFLHVSKYSCQVEWLITQSAPPLPLSACIIWQQWHKVLLGWTSGWGTDAQWSMSTASVAVNYSCGCDATARSNSITSRLLWPHRSSESGVFPFILSINSVLLRVYLSTCRYSDSQLL